MASPLATITPVEGVPAWRHSLTGPRVGAAEGTRRRQWPGPPRHRRSVERRLAASTPSASPSSRSARGAILALADGGTPIALVKPWGAVEEARRFRVLVLPPSVNRSTERFVVEEDAPELQSAPDGATPSLLGGVRVPLAALRGLTPAAALAVRASFGSFESLLDFLRNSIGIG